MSTRKLTDHERDAVARMIVAGQPVNLVAASVGKSPRVLQTLLENDSDLAERLDDVKGRFYRQVVTSFFRRVDMLDIADEAIRSGISSSDQRLSVETSKWLISQVTPRPAENSNVNLNVRGEVGVDLSGVLQSIGTKLGEISELRAGRPGYERHVRSGADALPRPTSSAVPVTVTVEDDSPAA